MRLWKECAQTGESCGLTFAQLQSLPDDVLMGHLKEGHNDALAVLFDRYHRLVFSIAVKVLRDPTEAEDVLQAVFLEIFRKTVQFDTSKGSTKVWLLQYAYHRSLNRHRYLRLRGLQHAEIGTAEEREAEESFLAASRSLNSLERSRMVREALRTLSAAQRRTLEMAFFEGLSLKEICERTGEAPGNVRHHYYRGLNRMRSFLQDEPASRRLSAAAEGAANVGA